MSDPYFTSKLIAPDTWIIHEPTDGPVGIPACYLLVGDDRAMLIDSCWGLQDLHAYVKTLTDKPIIGAACTHGHPDHTGGISWFNTAFMTKESEDLRNIFFSKMGRDLGDTAVVLINEGYTFNLGNRTIETISLSGHTMNASVYLDRDRRLLFAGDGFGNDSMLGKAPGGQLWWKYSREQPSVFSFMQGLAKLFARRDEYDVVWWGHGHEDEVLSGDIVNHFLVAALEILEGIPTEKPPRGEHLLPFQQFDFKYYDCMRAAYYKDARIIYDLRYVNSVDSGNATPYM